MSELHPADTYTPETTETNHPTSSLRTSSLVILVASLLLVAMPGPLVASLAPGSVLYQTDDDRTIHQPQSPSWVGPLRGAPASAAGLATKWRRRMEDVAEFLVDPNDPTWRFFMEFTSVTSVIMHSGRPSGKRNVEQSAHGCHPHPQDVLKILQHLSTRFNGSDML